MKKPSKQLIQQWYKKLEESGFQDIETASGFLTGTSYRGGGQNASYHHLRTKGKSKFTAFTQATESCNKNHDIQNYYYLAEQFANCYEFKSEIDKQLWTMYADGQTYREMGKTIGKSAYWVFQQIKRLKPEFSLYTLLNGWQEPKESL